MGSPKQNVIYRAWVILDDGRVGYIDHYKSDGRFGVRPVNRETGLHYPNPSRHFTDDQKLEIPEELNLRLQDFRPAIEDELPPMYRNRVV
jgi:hypothetical protein